MIMEMQTMQNMCVLKTHESPIGFSELKDALAYADKEGYRHIIFNGELFSKVHKNIDDAFMGRDTMPPDTWVKTGLELAF